MTVKLTKKGLITIIAFVVLVLIIAIFIYQSSCQTCKMEKANKNCDNDNTCTSLKEQLKDPREVFLLSISTIQIQSSKQGHLYFGVKNVFAQSLVLYPDITCNSVFGNNNLDQSKIAVEKSIIIPYTETKTYSVYINAPSKKEKYLCVLILYNDEGHKEEFSQKGFTLDVV